MSVYEVCEEAMFSATTSHADEPPSLRSTAQRPPWSVPDAGLFHDSVTLLSHRLVLTPSLPGLGYGLSLAENHLKSVGEPMPPLLDSESLRCLNEAL